MTVKLLLSAGDGECLVLAPDGKVFKRTEGGEQVLALDPTQALPAGETLDPDVFAQNAGRWGMSRVVGSDNEPYPEFAGHGLPGLEPATLEGGEPVFRVAASDNGADTPADAS
jgi:hypothetical protein